MKFNQAVNESKQGLNFTVDSFEQGIAFGQHYLQADQDPRDYYALRICDNMELVRLRSRYCLNKTNPLHELELRLMKIAQRGRLSNSSIYFGVSTDPFFPFDGKFDASMKFLDIFQRYTPGLLTVQTRSPLIVLALPVLKRLKNHVSVTIGIETHLDQVGKRYTPELPLICERLKAAQSLRNFGVEVTLQVYPILPYGDWRQDAPEFAKVLVQAADYIHIKPMHDGSLRSDRLLKNNFVANKLALDRKFHWLRADAGNPLISAIEKIAPEKLLPPHRLHLEERQMQVFA